jgi:hypothetical protein
MQAKKLVLAVIAAAVTVVSSTQAKAADASAAKNRMGLRYIQHVLLLSIDGMHAVDFYNCANGIASINGGDSYCPNLAALSLTVCRPDTSASLPLPSPVTESTEKSACVRECGAGPRD